MILGGRRPFGTSCQKYEYQKIFFDTDYYHNVHLFQVRIEAMMWGLGTALGELPPYFMARAARMAHKPPPVPINHKAPDSVLDRFVNILNQLPIVEMLQICILLQSQSVDSATSGKSWFYGHFGMRLDT